MIRTARPEDAAALVPLAAATFPLACPPDALPEAVQDFINRTFRLEHFEAYLADPDRLLLVADRDGVLEGYTMLVFREPSDPDVVGAITRHPSAELSKCYVLATAHGTGLAGDLMLASIAAARDRGAAGLWLGVNNENAKANRFYEKHGFAIVGQRWEDDFVRELVL